MELDKKEPPEYTLPLELYDMVKDFLPKPYTWKLTLSPPHCYGVDFHFEIEHHQEHSSFKTGIHVTINYEQFPYLRSQLEANGYIEIQQLTYLVVTLTLSNKNGFSLQDTQSKLAISRIHPQFSQLDQEIRQGLLKILAFTSSSYLSL